nr:MAG TPA: hypothetical protein [Caudoviricetes sp.]
MDVEQTVTFDDSEFEGESMEHCKGMKPKNK